MLKLFLAVISGMLVFCLMCSIAAHEISAYAPDTGAGSSCADFEKMLNATNGLESHEFSIQEMEIFNKKCHIKDNQLSSVLSNFFDYNMTMRKRDPDMMAYNPGTNFKELESSAKAHLRTLLERFKNGDKKVVTRVVRFMVAQRNHVAGGADISYETAALEIVARDFPGEYSSYESLSDTGSDEREAWQAVKERWLKDKSE